MQFIANGTTINLSNPQYGYKAIINLAIKIDRFANKFYHFDRTATYDFRTCVLPGVFTSAEMNNLSSFFYDSSIGRAENFTLRLGATPTGFFPFGPDLGDVGDFTCRLTNRKPSGMKLHPYKHFNDDLELVLVTAPTYSLPSQVSDGSFQIGTITGLRFPQSGFNPISEYAFDTGLTEGGVPYSVDQGRATDIYTVDFTQECKQTKAAALVNHLVSTVRSNNVTIAAHDGYYLFGRDNASSGNYTAKLITDKIEIVCVSFDEFEIPLKFWKAA